MAEGQGQGEKREKGNREGKKGQEAQREAVKETVRTGGPDREPAVSGALSLSHTILQLVLSQTERDWKMVLSLLIGQGPSHCP